MLSAFFVLAVALGSPTVCGQEYTTFDFPPNFGINVTDMNSRGTIVGIYNPGFFGPIESLLRESNGMTTLIQLPGALSTNVVTITNSGDAAGTFTDTTTHGFLRNQSGDFTIIDAPGGFNTTVLDANDRGEIVGTWVSDRQRGFIRGNNGAFTSFEVSSDSVGVSNLKIGPSGIVAGSYFAFFQGWHGFVRDNRGAITGFDIPNVSSITVWDVSEKGEVVGYYHDGSTDHGFLRAIDGNIVTLDYPGATLTFITGINASGTMIGTYSTGFGSHGFILDSQNVFTSFDVPGALSTFPTTLGQNGAIAGTYVDSNNVQHGFIRK
jgi:hypothetical protein